MASTYRLYLLAGLFGAVATARVMRRVLGRGLKMHARLSVVHLRAVQVHRRPADPARDGAEARAGALARPAGLRLVEAARRVGARALARHGRDLLGGQPQLFDHLGVAHDHQEEGQHEHDEQLVQGDKEAAVRAETLLLPDIHRVHAIYREHAFTLSCTYCVKMWKVTWSQNVNTRKNIKL